MTEWKKTSAVDTVAGAADQGTVLLAVRDDALGGITPAEGDYASVLVDDKGAVWVANRPVMDTVVGDGSVVANAIDNAAGNAKLLGVGNTLFNNAGWDRQRSNYEVSMATSAARVATWQTGDQTLYNGRGIRVVIDCTVDPAAASVIPNIQIYSTLGNKYVTVLAGTAFAAVGTYTYVVYPGCVAVAGLVANEPLARLFRLNFTHADGDSITYSASAQILL